MKCKQNTVCKMRVLDSYMDKEYNDSQKTRIEHTILRDRIGQTTEIIH